MLWSYDNRVFQNQDPEGDDRLHNLLGSKSGSGFPWELAPSSRGGVWVQDIHWSKEFMPGEGMISTRKAGEGGIIGPGPTEGSVLVRMGSVIYLDSPGEGLRMITGHRSGGDGGFTAAQAAWGEPDGTFLLYDELSRSLRRYTEEGRLVESLAWGLRGLQVGTGGALWAEVAQGLWQPLDRSAEPIQLEGWDTVWAVAPADSGFWGLSYDSLHWWDASGKLQGLWPLPVTETAPLDQACLTVLPDGRAAVLKGARVALYDREQGMLTAWGEAGPGAAQLGLKQHGRSVEGPGGIASTPDGLLIIADNLNGALKGSTAEGQLVWSATLTGGPGTVGIRSLSLDGEGNLWTCGLPRCWTPRRQRPGQRATPPGRTDGRGAGRPPDSREPERLPGLP